MDREIERQGSRRVIVGARGVVASLLAAAIIGGEEKLDVIIYLTKWLLHSVHTSMHFQ